MGKQANILSFDEVKRGSDTHRPKSSASRRGSQRQPAKSAGRQVAQPPVARVSAAARYAGQSPSSSPSGRRGNSTKAFTSQAALTTFSDRGTRTRRDVVSRPSRANSFEYTRSLKSSENQANQAEEEVATEKKSRFAAFRHKRQKAQAGKKFTKQFGGERPPSDASSGPRAAVYKGEMGSTHRRSSRMQNEASSRAYTSVKPGVLSGMGEGKSSSRLMISTAFVVCLAFAGLFLYGPAQQLYHSVRDYDRLQAEYAAIEQRNTHLKSEVDNLTTSSGVEDRAHREFGWVKDGEETATVRGLSEEPADESSFTANIVTGSVPAPTTWYSPILDFLFGPA